MEPLSVATHALSALASFRTSQSIAVFGAGPVGLLCMAVAKALGARRIITIDIVPARLDFAKQYVGAEPFLPEGKPNEGEAKVDWSRTVVEDMMKKLSIGGPNSIDLVVDASGAEVCI
jgi:D-xylulose reductase